jgi:hypothetical protein
MRTPSLVDLALLTLLFSGAARATDRTIDPTHSGNEFLEYCATALTVENPEQVDKLSKARAGWCVGYIEGLYEAATVAGPGPLVGFRAPDGVTIRQFARVVVKYMKDHPADLHQVTAGLCIIALKEAFPCASGSANH